jgi:hypothetical protein
VTQYKQLQNSILSITSDHANVWVYIWVLSKSNIPVLCTATLQKSVQYEQQGMV